MSAVEWTQLRAVETALRQTLADALIAIQLHGSAVAGGLRPQSDLDLLVVVDRPLTETQRRDLLATLLLLSSRYPAVVGGLRCLEVTVFELADLAPREGLVRSAFTYGEWLRAGFEAGDLPKPVYRADNVLILAQARQKAKALLGPEASALLPATSDEEIRQAMRGALPDLLAGLHGDERNVLLTLARMWYTASTGGFVPKDIAAAWAAPRLPKPEAAVLRLARAGYLGAGQDDWQNRRIEARGAAVQLHRRLAEIL